MTRILCLLAALSVSACTPVAHGTQDSAHSSARARDDIAQAFSQLFTYKPRPHFIPPASTRYCYRFASDVVCYDNPQPHMTAKLVGVQGGEGARIITQPTPEQAFAVEAPAAQTAPMIAMPLGAPLDTSRPVASDNSEFKVETKNLQAPFHEKESPHATVK